SKLLTFEAIKRTDPQNGLCLLDTLQADLCGIWTDKGLVSLGIILAAMK
ncbi:MAG: hypothetical protein ACI8XU_002117, partial [Kiritimatiellia bacterium]